jgi:uncharacterized protein (DUF58 family)
VPSAVSVLNPKDFRVLEGMRLLPRKSFGGRVRGERLTKKKGISIEFADYREYTDGDDLRHLDWNVLARLDVPVTKTYQDEEDLAVHVLLDVSPSMTFGEPSKLFCAKKFGCALGFLGLAGGDAVYPRALGARERQLPALRGRASFSRLTRWAEQLESPSDQGSPLSSALRQFASASVRAGLVILLSDGLDPEITTALRIVAGRGHEVLFLQVLSQVELDPDLEGDLRLVDGEGGAPAEITANGSVLKEYMDRLRTHNDSLRDTVLRVGGRYALVRPDEDFDTVLSHTLKRQRWIG